MAVERERESTVSSLRANFMLDPASYNRRCCHFQFWELEHCDDVFWGGEGTHTSPVRTPGQVYKTDRI